MYSCTMIVREREERRDMHRKHIETERGIVFLTPHCSDIGSPRISDLKKTPQKINQKGNKKFKRLSRIIYKRLHTSTKLDVREYEELWFVVRQINQHLSTLLWM